MNAIEFVKKFGLDKAKKLCVTQAPVSADYYNVTGGYVRKVNKKGWIPSENCVCIIEVKQIVDAWELVGLHGSLKLANHYAMKKTCLSEGHTVDELWDAINLVEKLND